jgi:hypothetical protein
MFLARMVVEKQILKKIKQELYRHISPPECSAKLRHKNGKHILYKHGKIQMLGTK